MGPPASGVHDESFPPEIWCDIPPAVKHEFWARPNFCGTIDKVEPDLILVWSCVAATCSAHLVLAPADVAWKSCALRIVFCDPRWVPNPARQSRCGRALQLRVSRESEVAANETRTAGRRGSLHARIVRRSDL
jgi:hypothetical protein